MDLTERICERARDLGFDLVGVTPARPTPHLDAYRSWLAQGYHGEMGYMARPDRVKRREDPARIMPGVRSIICVGLNYYAGVPPTDLGCDPSRGLISNYAWGLDYHDLMIPRLEELAAFAGAEVGADDPIFKIRNQVFRKKPGFEVAYRAYVDTGPVLERAYAADAGLGFIGKNTCLIHPKMGSWLFLGEILLNLKLDPTPEKMSVSCGTCRRCLDACPTGALVAPYVLDARRCISYLTIELKGPIPHELRPLMDNWIYGCDVCQAVCPWQRFARPTGERSFHADEPHRTAPVLSDLIEMDEEAFRQRYGGTPIFRVRRRRLLRNAAVALGNWGDRRAVPALVSALTDVESLVRGHAAWALGRIGGRVVRKALGDAWQREKDPYVRHEIKTAMRAL
jgi:epoxyqueuosine reductase